MRLLKQHYPVPISLSMQCRRHMQYVMLGLAAPSGGHLFASVKIGLGRDDETRLPGRSMAGREMADKNLWGSFEEFSGQRSPLILFREQAAELHRLTNGVLRADVEVDSVSSGGDMSITLKIVAPRLNYYSFSMARALYGFDAYPCNFIDLVNEKTHEQLNQQGFEEKLSETLQSERVRRGIARLISESK